MAPMLDRLHPRESSIGLRNTARVNSVPIDMLMTTNAAPSTTQRQRYEERSAAADMDGGRAALAGEDGGLGGSQVLLGVDLHRGLVRLDHANGDAGFHEAKLLELLGLLQRGGRQGVEGLQRRSPERVESHVL